VCRRLSGLGWETRREVTIVGGRARRWIDVLAFDPRRRLLLVVEIKTWLDDLGAIERQLDWYKREASGRRYFGDRPVRTIGWLLFLATAEVDAAISRNRDAFDVRFAARAGTMRRCLDGGAELDDVIGDGVALIDPRRRRKDWLLPCRADGRRSPAPYPTYAAAMAAMSA
jgi:hypothetical protein